MYSSSCSPPQTSHRHSLANRRAAAIGITETHVAGADRTRQIHALVSVSARSQALSHDPHIDLLNQGGGISSGDHIGEIGVHKTARRTDHVIAELQVDDVI